MKVKLIRAYNQGSIYKIYAKDKENILHTIPFDHRMFRNMWECLTDKQKQGREFVELAI